MAAGIWFARRPASIAMQAGLLLAAVMNIGIASLLAFASQPEGTVGSDGPFAVAKDEAGIRVDVIVVEDGERIRVTLPQWLKPSWMGVANQADFPPPRKEGKGR